MPESKRLTAAAPRASTRAIGWKGSIALCAAHAIFFALMLPPFDWWPLAVLAPVPLAWCALEAKRTRIAIVCAFVSQLLMWMWLLRWIVPVTAIGYPALCAYLSIYAAVFVVLLRYLRRNPLLLRLPITVVLPFAWTAVEFFRGDVLFDGYPWYLLAHPLINLPIAVQSADLFGTYFVGFQLAIISGALLDGLLWIRGWNFSRRAISLTLVLVLVVVISNLAYGRWRLNQPISGPPGPAILAIQTNLPQDNKVGWDEQAQAKDVPKFIAQTRAALENVGRVDLIVWPETMVPGLGYEPDLLENLRIIQLEKFYRWPDAVLALSRELKIPMLVGIESWVNSTLVPEGNRVRVEREFTYNSAVLLQGHSPFQRYDKFFLTPFGETMPYISAWPWLERLLLNIGVGANLSFELDSNPDLEVLVLEWKSDTGGSASARLATPICFEDTVARLCRRMAYRGAEKRIDVFVNISNDGWFNTSIADRKLHAQIARFRCIENRVPMVRCVNTGMSIWIDSAGRIVAAAGGEDYGVANQPASLLAKPTFDHRRTLYGLVGELWPWSCLAIVATAVMWILISRRQENN